MLDVDTINRFKDGHLVYHYLLSSYCYYILDLSPLTDSAYDRLCVRLIERWDAIDADVYPHKTLISHYSLQAGTAYDIPDERYPTIVRSSAWHYYRTAKSGQLRKNLEPHLLPVRTQRIMRTSPAAAAPVAAVSARPGRIVRTPPKGS
jgi:hypothetical protein